MSKRLVVCCDGTWNKLEQLKGGVPASTNVTKVFRTVAQSDLAGRHQVIFYQPGVGTKPWERIRGGVFGAGLGRNVLDAYRFVVQTYEPGDEIFFFGFSRGAFTVRSTAGFIRNSGILRPEHADLADHAFELYRDRKRPPDSIQAERFRRSYSYPNEKPIRFIGVWDTVGTLGIPITGLGLVNRINRWRWGFHDPRLSSEVGAAFHALAIDEKRAPFQPPTIWTQSEKAENQRLEQVWFAGVHKDIGGGYQDSALSDIALLWMVDRARDCGLVFRPDSFAGFSPHCQCADELRHTGRYVEPDPSGEKHESWKGIYWLSRPIKREPGHIDKHHEYVASSVAQRQAHYPNYLPTNILTNAANTLSPMQVPTKASNSTTATRPERPRSLKGPCPSRCPWNRASHGSAGAS